MDTISIKSTIPPPPSAIPSPPKAPSIIPLAPVSPLAVSPPPSTPSSAGAHTLTAEKAKETRDLITDLKIKIANVNKTLLDLEMQNITGDLSDEDFATKSQRLEALKGKIAYQMKELEQL